MNLDEAVIIALGGDLPWQGMSPREVLDAALDRFPAAGLDLVKRSRWWRSAAWPDPTRPGYINGVALVRTAQAPRAVMNTLLAIEAAFGRKRDEPNAPRTLDLDLIAHGRTVVRARYLVLPHRRAAERYFVMGPLAEIAPGWRHPLLGRSAAALAASCEVGRDATPIE